MPTSFEIETTQTLSAIREELALIRSLLPRKHTKWSLKKTNQIVSSEDFMAWWEDGGCGSFTSRDVAAGLLGDNNPDKRTLMLLGAQAAALGFSRVQVRVGDQRVWRFVKRI